MVVSSSAQVTEHQRGAGLSARYNNRELSWLKFNQRVLAQAEDSALPLLERLNFCAIYASNLDEFYMVRVAGLKDQLAAGVEELSPDGLTPSDQLRRIGDSVDQQLATVAELFAGEIGPGLSDEGIEIVGWGQLSPEERAVTNDVFERRIFPVLTPLAVDPGHPFPYIPNLSLNLAVLLRHPDGEPDWFARVKVPETLQRFVNVGGYRYVPVEEIISHHLGSLFTGLDVIGGWPFRVTRNSDMSLDDEDADDLLEAVEHELRRRRFGSAVRLEITSQAPAAILELLQAELDLDDSDILPVDGILDLTALRQLHAIDRPDLKFSRSIRVAPHRLQNLDDTADIFDRIAAEDILLHHPYESFNASVTNFVRYASEDPAVQAIKVTLYRTSGDSPIVNALIAAAEQGKQVAALVELKARFDEQANIAWARRLEDAGAHVVYGMVGLKTHTKVAMVVRDEPQGLRRYCHIGTGNYNPKTARFYEDVGLLTASDAIGSDLSQLFNYLTGYGVQAAYERLIVAPDSLRPKMVELIDQEIQAGSQGHLLFKMNSLVDPQLIDKLYEASAKGVRVQLVVRGICCLRPGVVGLSENITVRSIVGRYLEHSRIFYFANGYGPGEELYLFGSADLMPRNLDRRIEAMLLVDGSETKRRLREILDINLADTALAWDLDEAGEYRRQGGDVNAQQRFVQLARDRSQ